ITTRIVSLAPGVPAAAAAAAVRLRKVGTVRPQETRLPVANEVFKKSLRVGFMVVSSVSFSGSQNRAALRAAAKRPNPVETRATLTPNGTACARGVPPHLVLSSIPGLPVYGRAPGIRAAGSG